MTIQEKFKKSAQQLKSSRSLTVAGMMLAINIVVGYLGNYTLMILPSTKLSLSFLPKALTGTLLGPVVSAIVGGAGDILSFFLNPQGGGYFPGWTINAILSGLIYGIFLYKKNATLKNIIIANAIIMVFVSLLLGTFWLHIQFGMPYFITLWGRTAKEIISFPIETFLIYFVLKAINKIPHVKRI